MTKPLTFPRGGIHVPPRSQESRRVPIANAAMPPVAVVPMRRRGERLPFASFGPAIG